jgi:hypothetical protein
MSLIIVPLNNFEGLMLQNTTFDGDINFVDSIEMLNKISLISVLLRSDHFDIHQIHLKE